MAKRSVAADPRQWSEKSQRSVSAAWKKEYVDIPYSCWRCKKAAVFSAEDQKYSFEIKKNQIDQRRVLCPDCWMEANRIRKSLGTYQARWNDEKKTLKKDTGFLTRWLSLLTTLDEYEGSYRADTAKKNMLKKLIKENA